MGINEIPAECFKPLSKFDSKITTVLKMQQSIFHVFLIHTSQQLSWPLGKKAVLFKEV
jgi:hypothetical protein